MNFTQPDFAPAYAEIFLLVMVCVVLLADLAWGEKKSSIAYLLAQISLLGCMFITFATSAPGVVYTFSGMFVDDAMADILKMLVYITVSTVLVYSRNYISLRGMLSGEFFGLALFATLGMMVMISASHFLTLYLGLELLSLSLYAMVALRRTVGATEAAIKFFVLGALASGFLLYGMSMIYGSTGSLDIPRIVEVIQTGSINHPVLVVGLVFIVAGISFKLSAAPFHMWVPDVYEGAPTAVVLFVGSAPKLAAFGFVMRLLAEGLGGMAADWQGMLIILAVISMVIGNLAAIAQTNIKRMLAYSTISHMGFMLLGIIGADGNGYSAAMFYVVVYVLMTLGTFGMIILLSREGFEAEKLDDFKGLNRRNPWYAFIMLLLMFSMAGIPPTVGIYAKLSVLQAVLSVGYVWLAVVAVLLSLIGVFYYLRIVKLMYFDEPETDAVILPQPDVKILLSANGLAMLGFGLFPQALIALCAYAIQQSM
ncbi:NADH-quinone oxidoreductase subunit NuoN [Nitrosovibrio sp. Nv6]|uniref:NADH-quinone oxidoreductase subunit NuoN n=1 Tax=Nitrosovibrio sp. Nv6 TaxID=1855340 RepID=UPI0008D1AC64|nr:NADH-quinone oxidoreductase subunit NuoN [Nitrosovibrio sp. Nv6]SEO34962.1 NADH-quinone oxidoreductase subunit N [Nitrosovibrio sp. Nv6]